MEQERNFWIVGGDQRQLALAEQLQEDGHTVHMVGLEGEDIKADPLEEIVLAHCVVLPLPITTPEGFVHAPLSRERMLLSSLLYRLEHGQILCGGMVSEQVRRAAEGRGLRLFDYYAREECMVANAVPTAAAKGQRRIVFLKTIIG